MSSRQQVAGSVSGPPVESLVAARFEKSMVVPEAFFAAEADRIAQACWAMARRFHQGGRLIAFGNGASASDAQHVSVEFVHPVIVGKRALPALALTNDSALLTGLSFAGSGLNGATHAQTTSKAGNGTPFVRQLALLARPQDMAMGFSQNGRDANILAALKAAKQMGCLTLGLSSGDSGEMAKSGLDFCFAVPNDDPLVVQETHETLYHILWELVHVFLEHEGLLT